MTHPTPPHDSGPGPAYPSYPPGPGSMPTQASQYGAPAGAPLPPSNAGWAVATILFFWPVSFAAFNHLHNIYPSWAMGDYQGAQAASDRVKSLGKIALWVFAAFFIFIVVIYGIAIAAAISSAGSSGYGG